MTKREKKCEPTKRTKRLTVTLPKPTSVFNYSIRLNLLAYKILEKGILTMIFYLKNPPAGIYPNHTRTFIINIAILERVCDSCSMFTQDQDCCKVGGKILQFTFLVIYDCVLVALATAWSLVGLIYVLNNVPKSPFYKIEQSLGGVGESIKKGFENLSGQEPAEEDKVFDCNIHVYNISIVSIFVGFVVAVLTLVFLVFGRLCCDLCCCGPCAKEKDNVSIHSQKHREVKDPDDRLATRVA